MYKVNCDIDDKVWIETPYYYEQDKKGVRQAVSYFQICGLYNADTERLVLYVIRHRGTERNLQEIFKNDKMKTLFSIINKDNLRSDDVTFIDLDGNTITYLDLVQELKDFIKENDL